MVEYTVKEKSLVESQLSILGNWMVAFTLEMVADVGGKMIDLVLDMLGLRYVGIIDGYLVLEFRMEA